MGILYFENIIICRIEAYTVCSEYIVCFGQNLKSEDPKQLSVDWSVIFTDTQLQTFSNTKMQKNAATLCANIQILVKIILFN